MKTNKLLMTLVLTCTMLWTQAQKVEVISGDIKTVSGETKFNIQYDFSSFGVGKYGDEQSYVDAKKTEYAAKDPAKATEFETNWKAAKTKIFQPKFETTLNKYLGSDYNVSSSNTTAKYTIILKTKYVEPGFFAGMVKKYPYVDVEFFIVETINTKNIVADLSGNKMTGIALMGPDDMKVGEAYAAAGRIFGSYMAKSLIKR